MGGSYKINGAEKVVFVGFAIQKKYSIYHQC